MARKGIDFNLEPHMMSLAILGFLLTANADAPEQCPSESPAQLFIRSADITVLFLDTQNYYYVYWVRPTGEVLDGIYILDNRTKTTWSAVLHRAVAGDEVMVLSKARVELDGPGARGAFTRVVTKIKDGDRESSCFEQIPGSPFWAAVFTD